MQRLEGICRSKENTAKSKVPVENVGLSQLSITFDDFHPDKQDLNFTPPIILSCFSVHDKVEKASLKVPKNDNKSIESSSTHDEIVNELILVKGLVQRYLVKTLFQFGISKTVEFNYFGYVVMSSCCRDVKIDLTVQPIVIVEYWTSWCLEVKVHSFIQFKVSKGVHDSTFNTDSVHLHCVLS